jgi:hypothetical protein
MKAPLTRLSRTLFVIGLLAASAPLRARLHAQEPPPAPEAAPAAPLFKAEELEQLAAPIALYPDALLAQVFMASTYPLEVVQAARWMKENASLKDKALEDALQKQPWDASVKSLVPFPQVLTMMNEKLDWTQKLGDAFLAQPKDVMDAVQRLRAKAQAEGTLQTTKEQTVVVQQQPASVAQDVTVEQAAPAQTTVIKIEPTDPQVVYVPTYNPTTAYGTWPYPAAPPYSYYPPGYTATASLLSFGAGMAVGAALWGDCDWGGGDVDIDVNEYNNFNNTNISNKNWEHNAEHRKGVQYRDQASQQKYGQKGGAGASSREAYRGRAEQGRQELARGGGDQARRDLERGSQQREGTGRGDAASDRGQQRGKSDSASKRGQQRSTDSAAARSSQRDTANRQAAQRSRDSGALQGMDNGAAARRDSSRGQASRQSASSWGGSGGSGGRSGGGGGRSGGGGGGRGGGGGGRGGGGRR